MDLFSRLLTVSQFNFVKDTLNQDDEVATSIEHDFIETFAIGVQFSYIDELEAVAKEFGKEHSVVLTTLRSNKRMVYLICKHGQEYCATKKPATEAENNEKDQWTSYF
ncbi:hypothetical protein G6F70_004019 [Rhizopus microsporus]|nr:hypothetical protein G6F71_004054 [Rhizopus microsporus]KAG1200501.1 hypothetical protein G6F70_004019 [Rhizopus microsporus]KAG1212229.1 hypothetical protein G6F69_003900 [Rhizopus microsporus]